MQTRSNRELARHLGVSETAVRRAEKTGRIRREADGGWDLARVEAAWAGSTDPAQQRPKQARTANEVLKAQERRLRLQRMKGKLVDRAKAVAQVFKLARDERDAWVNWPARGGGDDRGGGRSRPPPAPHGAGAPCPGASG